MHRCHRVVIVCTGVIGWVIACTGVIGWVIACTGGHRLGYCMHRWS